MQHINVFFHSVKLALSVLNVISRRQGCDVILEETSEKKQILVIHFLSLIQIVFSLVLMTVAEIILSECVRVCKFPRDIHLVIRVNA